MSNPTNIPSLLQLAGSCVINNNLTSNPDLDEVTKYRCRSGLLAIWDDLRFHPNQRFCLGSIMWNLQESVVKDYLLAHHLSVITFDEKRAILCEKVDLLFRKLAQKFDAESLFGSVIPVDFLSYDFLQQKFEDEGASRVQLGYRVEAGREVLSRRPLPRLDLADHVVRDVGPGGQVLLGQACPGPVEAQLRAEHACGRPGSVGIVRHLIGILSGRAALGRRSVGIRADPVSNGSPRATGCEIQIRPQGEEP